MQGFRTTPRTDQADGVQFCKGACAQCQKPFPDEVAGGLIEIKETDGSVAAIFVAEPQIKLQTLY